MGLQSHHTLVLFPRLGLVVPGLRVAVERLTDKDPVVHSGQLLVPKAHLTDKGRVLSILEVPLTDRDPVALLLLLKVPLTDKALVVLSVLLLLLKVPSTPSIP